MSYFEELSLYDGAVVKAAEDFLKGKGIKDPFPPSKPLEIEQMTLRNQLEGLSKKYESIQENMKKIQAARRQIDQAFIESSPIEL